MSSLLDLNTANNKATLQIQEIPVVDFRQISNHYFEKGLLYSLINNQNINSLEKTCYIQKFEFKNLQDKQIPFLKLLPKISTTSSQSFGYRSTFSFLYNWEIIDTIYFLTTGIYLICLPDASENNLQVYFTLDIYFKAVPNAILIIN